MSASSEHRAEKTEMTGQLQGLNQLRFLAALLVFTQHSLSCCHLDEWIDVAGFRIGRIGTALFFLLGGFLSASTRRKPLSWIKDRLIALFPSYWVVTIVGFILAAVTATKTFDGWQVLSQLAGMGYFTHGDHIVNVATWFISPLLLMYAAVVVARLISVKMMTPVLIAGMIVEAFLIEPEFSSVRCHAVTFFMAFFVASAGLQYRNMAALLMTISMITLSAFQPEFRYGAIASAMLFVAFQVEQEVRLCNLFSKFAYEWFLVHGLCLAIVSHLTPSPPLIIVGGAVASIISALLLQKFVRWGKSIRIVNSDERLSDSSRSSAKRNTQKTDTGLKGTRSETERPSRVLTNQNACNQTASLEV